MHPIVTYYTIAPPARLAPFVRMYWVYEIDHPVTPYIYRSMADGCAELVFHYRGMFDEVTPTGLLPQSAAMLHAQTAHHRRFVTHGSFSIFGAYLYPFTLRYLLGMPVSETSNYMPSLQDVLGQDGTVLEERIMLAEDNCQRADALSAYLTQRLAQTDLSRHSGIAAIRSIIHAKDSFSVRALANKFNLSPRQLERQFKDLAGFSPKLYSRINRFQTVLQHYNSQQSLTDIAHSCGYYDQSHFIHDFKAFSGYHPRTYFKGLGEGVEYRSA